jgi:hypothetical protein
MGRTIVQEVVMRNPSRQCLFILICLLCSPGHLLFAASNTISATAEGVGVIVDNNTALARDQAVADALRNVVEQAAGIMVASETLVQNYETLRDQIYSKSQGYVRNYQVTEEKIEGNLYRATVQASVSEGNLKDDLMALGLLIARKNKPRIMIMVAEQNIGMHVYSYWWGVRAGHADINITENTLMEKLSQKGFNVVDHAVKTQTLELSSPYKIESLGNDAIQTIGNLFDAEVVLYGKALAKLAGSVMGTSMKSAQADVSLRAVNTDNGQVIASATNHAAAVHPSDVTAGANALKIATESIADQLVEQITERWNSDLAGSGMIQLVITGVRSYQHLVRFKEMVQKQVRGVSGIYQREFDAGVATLDITASTAAQNLADELAVIDFGDFAVDITGISQNTIDVKMK